MNELKKFTILTMENLEPDFYQVKAFSKKDARNKVVDFIKKEKKGVYFDFYILDEKTKLNEDALDYSLTNLIFFHLQQKQEKRMQADSIGSDADGM